MNSVSGVSSGQLPQPNLNQNVGATQSAQQSVGSRSTVTSSSSSSSSSLSLRISSFVNTVGVSLTDEQVLRQLVMLLLIEMLTEGDDEKRSDLAAGIAGAFGSEGLLFSSSSARSQTFMHSSTNVSQSSTQSTLLDSSQAIQSLTSQQSAGDSGTGAKSGEGTSPKLDVSG